MQTNKTKEQLLKDLEYYQEQLEIAEQDKDYWYNSSEIFQERVKELENELGNIQNKMATTIGDINNFKFELSKNDLDNKELLEFIDKYIKYYN